MTGIIKKAFTILVLTLGCAAYLSVSAQVIVKGKVTDEKGEPVVGAAVFVAGTQTGTFTGLDGTFSLPVAPGDKEITVSSIGYLVVRQAVRGAQYLQIVLKEDVSQLEQSVVVGYGSVLKKNLTGAVGVVTSSDLKDMPVTNVNNVLQGKITGVTVTSTSGTPGSGSATRIRGIGSINGSTAPLYIVDGLPQSGIDYLSSEDIETITVHKDASAAAIYGSRAANGIIMITTRNRANGGRATVSYDGYVGIQSPWKRPYMLNAEEFIAYKNLVADNSGQERIPAFATQENIDAVMNFVRKNSGPEGTDWWNEIIDSKAFMHNHNVTVSGGGDNLGFTSSLSYLDQNGIVKGSSYSRLSWRNNFNMKISERIRLTGNFSIIDEKRLLLDENNPYTGTVYSAMGADPITPVFRHNLVDVPDILKIINNGYEPDNYYSWYSGILFSNKRNPVAQIERMRQSTYEYLFIKGGANLAIELLRGLVLNSRVGFDITRASTSGFQPKYSLNVNDYANENKVVENNERSKYISWEETLDFHRKFGDFDLGVLAGVSAERTDVSIVNASIEGVVNNNSNMAILNAGTMNPQVTGYPYANSLLSAFGRINLNWKERYLLSMVLRHDGSSKFATGYKWGIFPSVSAAWRFSDEPFMRGLGWLNDGKLRVSYGIIGNQNISGGNYYSTFSSTRYDWHNFGDPDTALQGAGITSVGNAVLQWEKSSQFDVGVDLTLFDNSLEITGDWFYKKVDDMLLIEPLPKTLGFPDFPYSNVGSLKNTGVEFGATYRNSIGDFHYSVNGNISTYKNEVISLGNGDAIYGSAYLNQEITRTAPKHPVGAFYGYVTNGIFQNSQQVEGSPQRESAKPGDIRYKDLDGDDELTDADRDYIGSPWPDFVYGVTLNAAWKGFDFSMFIQGSQGNEVMNMTLHDFESGTGYMNARKGFLERAWNGENTTDRYHLISADQGQNQLVSDYFLEDGSYMRIKNIQFGYNFCHSLIRAPWLSYLRLYVSIQNALTLTHYSGLDPEIGSSSAILNGIDQGYYPQARACTIGVNVRF